MKGLKGIRVVFVATKEDTAHLRLSHSRRHFCGLDVQLSPSQSPNDSYDAATPSMAENLGALSLKIFYVTSPQTSFERVVDIGFHRVYLAI